MKATLVFNLDDIHERLAHKRALNGTNAYITLHCLMYDTLRKLTKYEQLTDDQSEIVDRISSDLIGYMEKYDINLDDLE